ncbi:MAG TPA: ACT domain-containing protein [Acidimicrobiia bacterium]|nr:ACT domain-containing protein [Acidimicrobiia bacterium]
MPWDITTEIENRPGTLAEIGETLGRAGVNIEGISGFPCEGVGVIHVLVDDPHPAVSALESAGVKVRGSREVLVATIEDRPGALGELARSFADAGINIDLVYLINLPEVVLGVDNMEAGQGLI